MPGLEITKITIFDENFENENILEIEKNAKIEKNNLNSEKKISENEKIFSFFEKNSLELKNISKIFFCNWPWRFMSMRISAIIANYFKNENPEIELFSIPTVQFLEKKSNWEDIFLQLNNSEVFTFIKNDNSEFEEKIYLREDLEKKFSDENKKFFYWNLRKWLFDFENFEEISEEKIFSDKKILKNFKKFFLDEKKFLVEQIKIFYWK